MSLPSRSKNSCGLTRSDTYRSPGLPPFAPWSASPVRRIWVPESTPAGTDTSSLRRLSSRPEPRQVGQGSEMTLPSPRQEPQVITWLKCPNMPCCERRIRPAPLQLTQVVGVLPGALLPPRHSRQISTRRTSISLSTPKTASSNERSTTISRSAPRCGALARAVVGPPPKNASKMSPKPPKLSKPSKPRPPLPLTPAWPNWS